MYNNSRLSLAFLFVCLMGASIPAHAESVEETIQWAGQGDEMAQLKLGQMYNKGVGVTKNKAESVKWIKKSAEQGNSDAQALLGIRYLNGDGVAEDKTEAIKWFQKAADQGNETALQTLTVLGVKNSTPEKKSN